MIAVIDTSAFVRLFIPDGPIPSGLEQFFRGVEQGACQAIAPEVMLAEAGNTVHKKTIQGLLTPEESDELIPLMCHMPVRYFSHLALLESAVKLARENNLTVYDALFLALAQRQAAPLFTADERLQEASARLGLFPAEQHNPLN